MRLSSSCSCSNPVTLVAPKLTPYTTAVRALHAWVEQYCYKSYTPNSSSWITVDHCNKSEQKLARSILEEKIQTLTLKPTGYCAKYRDQYRSCMGAILLTWDSHTELLLVLIPTFDYKHLSVWGFPSPPFQHHNTLALTQHLHLHTTCKIRRAKNCIWHLYIQCACEWWSSYVTAQLLVMQCLNIFC